MKDNILRNKLVLVAEDNEVNQVIAKHCLLRLGATAEIAVDGAEAVEKVKLQSYFLVLMDIQMPKMDGYEASRYIRKELKNNVPIIAMTAFVLDGEDAKCIDAGMNGYISKPFSIEDLQVKIEEVMAEVSGNSNPHVIGGGDVKVDLSMLYEIVGDDEEYIRKMVYTFLQNMPSTIEKLQQHNAAGEWELLFRAAHFAKSSLSIIRVTNMLETVQAIEGYAKNETNLSELGDLIKQVSQSYKEAELILLNKFPMQQNVENAV
jgi:CheY-like chemotaxis protein/HPt (histidine-containing phosphotransfer) domain-containing protein